MLVHPIGADPGACNEYSQNCALIAGGDVETGVDGECARYGAAGDVLRGDLSGLVGVSEERLIVWSWGLGVWG